MFHRLLPISDAPSATAALALPSQNHCQSRPPPAAASLSPASSQPSSASTTDTAPVEMP